VRRLRVLLSRLLRRGRTPAELSEELDTHLALLAAEYEGRGMTPDAALAEARRQFAGTTQIREQYREQRRLPFLDPLMQDISYALRQLRANPGFAAAAVLTLALGIGANLAIYQVMDAVLFRELPVHDPARLVQVQLLENNDPMRVSYPLFREISKQQQILDGFIAVSDFPIPASQGAKGVMVSGGYFHTLGVSARLGRAFTVEDDRPGAPPVAVISDILWQRQFGRSVNAIGQTLLLHGATAIIIGVTPPGFYGETLGTAPDFWVPMSLQPLITPGDRINGSAYAWLFMVGRLRDGVTTRQAAAALDPIFKHTENLTVQHVGKTYRIAVIPADRGIAHLSSRFERPLWLMMAMVGLVLIMLCSNLANLLLGRARTRTHEIGVRLALGAGRARIVRQLLTESLVLAGIGVALAIPFASRSAVALVALADVGAGIQLPLDQHSAIFALVTAILCTCLFGLAPALSATRVDVHDALQAHRHTVAGSRRRLFGNSLIVAQISFSLVLVSGAALFTRSLWNLRHQNFGMSPETTMVDLPLELNRIELDRHRAAARPLYERMNALPGVRSAAVSAFGPMESLVRTAAASTPTRPVQPGDLTRIVYVSPRYFETMDIPILAGRGISTDDRAGTPRVVVINQTAARAFFGGEDPVGRAISGSPNFDSKSIRQVVGVARDVRFSDARDPYGFVLYIPLEQDPMPVTSLVMRADPSVPLRAAVHEIAPDLRIGAIRTFGDAFDAGLGNDKLLAILAGAFGLLALVLSYVGVYGVLSYAVERRTHEIGIRIALGAGRFAVQRMIVSEAALLAAASIGIGGIGSLVATRALRTSIYGFVSTDYVLPVLAAALLCVVALAATYIPAHRAARLDPMSALRED
jgi:predicted permease